MPQDPSNLAVLRDALAAAAPKAASTAGAAKKLPEAALKVLATAFEFVSGRPDRRDPSGRLIAGDASYGPLQPDGTRQEGSDWNDFQGVTATYGGVTADPPERAQAHSLDCSGFMRMLWGVRVGLPLSLDPDGRSLLGAGDGWARRRPGRERRDAGHGLQAPPAG